MPVYATFTGLKGVPLLALATNSFAPLLRLHEEHIEFKVINTHQKSYQQIECVDTLSWALTKNITFIWNDSRFSFTANVIREDWLIQTLHFLQRRMVTLTPKAQSVINGTNMNSTKSG